MTTIIKLVVALVFVYAVAQSGMAAYKYYSFEDSVREVLLTPQATDADIAARIMDLAEDQDIPLDASKIQVSRTQNEVKANLSYEEDISLVPGIYTKTWTFTPTASARLLAGVSIPQKPTRRR
jgi:hypothetical protein